MGARGSLYFLLGCLCVCTVCGCVLTSPSQPFICPQRPLPQGEEGCRTWLRLTLALTLDVGVCLRLRNKWVGGESIKIFFF